MRRQKATLDQKKTGKTNASGSKGQQTSKTRGKGKWTTSTAHVHGVQRLIKKAHTQTHTQSVKDESAQAEKREAEQKNTDT